MNWVNLNGSIHPIQELKVEDEHNVRLTFKNYRRDHALLQSSGLTYIQHMNMITDKVVHPDMSN